VPAVLGFILLLQGSAPLRAGLDTLYSGDFERAAAYFAGLAARDTTDPAPVVFQAGAYIWWAAALDSSEFELARIDSLLDVALRRAQPAGAEFWRATALGYRARQREEHGHSFSAAKDAKAMRDIYRRLLAADSSCADCYLGLGVYDYGLARAGLRSAPKDARSREAPRRDAVAAAVTQRAALRRTASSSRRGDRLRRYPGRRSTRESAG